MAKQQLPKIKQDSTSQDSGDDKPTVVSQRQTVGEVRVEAVMVEIPFVLTSNGYERTHCDLGRLTAEQVRKLNAIRRGYDYSGITQGNGSPVKSNADAVKALIDMLEI